MNFKTAGGLFYFVIQFSGNGHAASFLFHWQLRSKIEQFVLALSSVLGFGHIHAQYLL